MSHALKLKSDRYIELEERSTMRGLSRMRGAVPITTRLGGIAEFEHSLIKARCDVGRDRSRAKGVRFGRKLKMTRHQIEEALRRREAGKRIVDIGRSYNVFIDHQPP